MTGHQWFLPDDVVTVTVVEADGDVMLDEAPGMGTGTGRLPVEDAVTVVSLEAEDDAEADAPTVLVTVVSLEADDDPKAGAPEAVDDSVVTELEAMVVVVVVTALAVEAEIALYRLESTLVTEVVTVEMAVGMGIGTGTMMGLAVAEGLMLEGADEPEEVTVDAADLGLV